MNEIGYMPPTPQELRTLLREMHTDVLPSVRRELRKAIPKGGGFRNDTMTGAAAGFMIGVDGRQIRRWTSEAAVKDSQRIPFAALYTLLYRACAIRIEPNNWRRTVAPLLDEQEK